MTRPIECVAVTGANGFVGVELVGNLRSTSRYDVRAVFRRSGHGAGRVVGDIGPSTDWGEALTGVDVVVHLAGVGVEPRSDDELRRLRETNVGGTVRLAEEAARVGVRRLVYLSTVKVLGESTPIHRPFTNQSSTDPTFAYPQSKHDAESELTNIACRTGLEVVFVRPPMVYGPRPVGNFARLVKLVEQGFPLPLRWVNNRRSFICRANLVDALVHCIDHPAARNRAFLVSDDEAFSTPDLIQVIADSLGRRPRLIPVPPAVLRFGARCVGRHEEARRLLGSLLLDISETTRTLDWSPPYRARTAIRRSARAIAARL